MNAYMYVPLLRWKLGEQLAVAALSEEERRGVLPIAEIQTLERDSLEAKLQNQCKKASGGSLPIGIDLSTVSDGDNGVGTLVDVVKALQKEDIRAVPVISCPLSQEDFVNLRRLAAQEAVIIRVLIGSASIEVLEDLIFKLVTLPGGSPPLTVVLDLGALRELDDEDVLASATLLQSHVQALNELATVPTIACTGGSFPISLGNIKQGVGSRIVRQELRVWQTLRELSGCADVIFGDYGVTNPSPVEYVDPRIVNPAVAIRYTQDDHWWVLRGAGVKTEGGGGYAQYNGLCQLLIKSSRFSGRAFSNGDERYFQSAQPGAKSGNSTTWRRDATSHHIVYTLRQIQSDGI